MDWLNKARQFVGNILGGAGRTISNIAGGVARGVGQAEQQAARVAQQAVQNVQRNIPQAPRFQLPQVRIQAPQIQLPQAPKIDFAAVGKALSDYYGKTALSQTTPQNFQKAVSQVNLNNLNKVLTEQGIGMLRQATGNVFIPSAGEINPENIMKYGTEKDKQALQKYLQTGKAGDVAIAPQVTRQGQTIYAPKGLSTAQQIANPLLAGIFYAGAKGPNIATSAAGKLAEGAASMAASNVAMGATTRYGETGKLSEAFQPKQLAIDLGTGLVTGAIFSAPGAYKAYAGQKALSTLGGQVKLQNLAKYIDKNAPITVGSLPEKGALRAQGYTNVKVQFQPKPGQVAPTLPVKPIYETAPKPGKIPVGEVVPSAQEIKKPSIVSLGKQGITGTTKEIKGIVAPATASQKAADASALLRQTQATKRNEAIIMQKQGQEAHNFFAKQSDAQNIAHISEYEKTGKITNAPKGYGESIKKRTDFAYNLNKETYGKNDLGYINNYVARHFDFTSPEQAAQASQALYNYTKSLKPSAKNVMTQRKLDMPLNEAIDFMNKQGYKYRLRSTNVEDITQQSVNQAVAARAFKQLGEQAKSENLITYVKPGSRVPDGMVRLSDPAFQVFYPSEAGLVKSGAYYTTPEAAKIFDNAISSGLEKYSLYRGARQVKNTMNMFQLGLSGFHAVTTGINASISDFALGARDFRTAVMKGNMQAFKQSAKEVTRSLIPTYSAIRQIVKGAKFQKGLRENNPEMLQVLKEKINPAGGTLGNDKQYMVTAYENMKKGFANAFGKDTSVTGRIKGFGRGVVDAPGALVEQTMKPLMNYAIPNAKLTAFLDLAAAEQRRLGPNATSKQLREAYIRAWDSIDNRYGELVYDNLHWNKVTKDLAMLGTRSVGWNLGTARELGGAGVDTAKMLLGKGGWSPRMDYAFALPIMAGMYGATYQYLMTGQTPQSITDLYYPRNGLKDKNGNDVRVGIPGYMKDVYAYAHDPVATIAHKASPLLSLGISIATNKNYWGDMIRNPDDPAIKQLQDTGLYAITNGFTPFTVTTGMKMKSEQASLGKTAQSLLGITQAPNWVIQSPAQQQIFDRFGKQVSGQARTPKEQADAKLKADARDAITNNSPDAMQKVDALIAQGVLSPKNKDQFIKESKMTPLQRAFSGLSLENKNNVINKGLSDKDKQLLGPAIDAAKLQAARSIVDPKTTTQKKDTAQNVFNSLGGGNAQQIVDASKPPKTPKVKVSKARKARGTGRGRTGRVTKIKVLKVPRLKAIKVAVLKAPKVSFKQPTPTKARKSIKIKTG